MTVRLQFHSLFDQKLYSPEPVIDDKGGKADTIDDKLDFLNREIDDSDKEIIDLDDKSKDKDDKLDKDKDKDKDKEDDKEDKDLEDLEKELKDDDVDEDKLELVTPVRRSEILKAYPKLFKEFPYLEKAYYREQQFTEVFPTLDDAKEASAKAEVLDKFEADLFAGKTEILLKSVLDNDPAGFDKLVDNYLPNLAAVSEKAYHHIIGNITKHTIQAMNEEAAGLEEESGNRLKIAAHILNQFVFGSVKFTAPTKLAKDTPIDDNKSKFDNERNQFRQEKFNDAVENLNTRVSNSIESTIKQYIDPKQSMTDFVRDHATADAVKEISDLLSKDTRFKTLVDKLWDKAAKSNFPKNLIDDIRNAYMSRAKTVLPTVIKTARDKALKGMGKRVEDTDKKGPITRRSTSPIDKDDKSGKDTKVPKNMSNLDFMMRDS